MNKIFKTKYSREKNAMVVVSELANNQGKTSSSGGTPQRLFFKLNLLAVLCCLVLSPNALARSDIQIDSRGIYSEKSTDDVTRLGFTRFVALNGYTTEGDKVNIPNISSNSVAVGFATKAQGNEATALGYFAGANAQSTAVGAQTYAYGTSSLAIGGDDLIAGLRTSDPLYGELSARLPNDTTTTGWFTKLDSRNGGFGGNSIYRDYVQTNTENGFLSTFSPTMALGRGSIAFGVRAIAAEDLSTAVGPLAMALAPRSTAIGYRSYVSTEASSGTAFGFKSTVFASNAIAVGNETEASQLGTVAYGYKTRAVADGSVAIGTKVFAGALFDGKADGSLKLVEAYQTLDGLKGQGNIQANTLLKGDVQSQQGFEAFDTAVDNLLNTQDIFKSEDKIYLKTSQDTIKRTQKYTDAKNAIAIGNTAFAVKKNSLALGYGTLADADNSFALGSYSYVKSNANNSIALGVATLVGNNAKDSFAAGTTASVLSEKAVAIGAGSRVETGSSASSAFGYGATITQAQNSLALGSSTVVFTGANSSVALGTGAQVYTNTTESMALGANATAGVVGTNSVARAIALGVSASASANDSMAIGNSSSASMANSVALGYQSTTNYYYNPNNTAQPNAPVLSTEANKREAKDLAGYVPPGSSYVIPVDNSAGVVSVGGWNKNNSVGLRRIINVAPGALDTDVATVGQLRALYYVAKEPNLVYFTIDDQGNKIKLVPNKTNTGYVPVNTDNGEPIANAQPVDISKVYVGSKNVIGATTITNSSLFPAGSRTASLGNALKLSNVLKGNLEAQNGTPQQTQGYDAVSGAQLYDLAVNVLGGAGLIHSNKTDFVQQTFDSAKYSGRTSASASAKTFKAAIDDTLVAINKGFKLAADSGTEQQKYLGDTIKLATNKTATEGQISYTGDNLKTYVDASAMYVTLRKDPTFTSVRFGDSASPNATNDVILTKDNGQFKVSAVDGRTAVKITNLASANLANNSTDAVNGTQLYQLVSEVLGATATGTTSSKASFASAKYDGHTTGGTTEKTFKAAIDEALTAINSGWRIGADTDGTNTNNPSKQAYLGQSLAVKTGQKWTNATVQYTGDNLQTYVNDTGSEIHIGMRKDPTFTSVRFGDSASPNATDIVLSKESSHLKIGNVAGQAVKLSNLDKAQLVNTSTEAVNGQQLLDLATRLGVGVDTAKTGFSTPSFTAVKYVTANAGGMSPTLNATAPTTVVGAISDLTTAVNKGIQFAADTSVPSGTTATKYLGDKLSVTSGDYLTTHKGQNLITHVKDNNIVISFKDDPVFNNITANSIGGGADKAQLTFGTDLTVNSKKITGLAEGALSANSTDAVTGKQLFALQNRTITLSGDTGSTTAQKLDNNIAFGIKAASGTSPITTSATGTDVKIDIDKTKLVNLIGDDFAKTDGSNVPTKDGNKTAWDEWRKKLGIGDGVNWVNVNSTATNPDNPTDMNYNKDHTGATGADSIAVGKLATTAVAESIALGKEAKVIAGTGAAKASSGGIAIGSGTTAKDNNVFVGSGISLTDQGVSAVAIGSGAGKSLSDSDTAKIGNFAVAVGANAYASETATIAIGAQSKATASKAVAFGTSAKASADSSLALGAGADASTANSVALGAGSKTAVAVSTGSYSFDDTAGHTVSKAFAGDQAMGTVSVGDGSATNVAKRYRTITNVAAGRISDTSTDAINGSQLYATIQAGLSFAGQAGATDTVAGATGQASVTKSIGKLLKVVSGNITSSGVNYVGDNLRTGISAAGDLIVGFKDKPEFKALTLADGGNSVKFSPTSGGLKLSGATDTDKVKLTNLADGTEATDAVTKGQVDNMGFKAGADTGTAQDVKLGKTLKVAGTTDQIKTSVAVNGTDGTTITLALDQKVTDKLAKIDSTKDYLTTEAQLKYKANGTGEQGVTLAKGLNFKNGTNTTAHVAADGEVKFDLNADLTGMTSISGAGTGTDAVKIAFGTDGLTLSKGSADAKLTGLAKGAVSAGSKDAVTGGQLNAVATQLGLTPNGNTGDFTNPTFTAIQHAGNTNNPTTFKDAVDKLTEAVNAGLKFKGELSSTTDITRQLGQTLGIVSGNLTGTANGKTGSFVGKNLLTGVSGENITIGMTETPEFKDLTLKNGANTVKLSPSATNTLKLSGANDADKVTLTNLADGTGATDAVTKGQVDNMGFKAKAGTSEQTVKMNKTLEIAGTANQLDATVAADSDSGAKITLSLAKTVTDKLAKIDADKTYLTTEAQLKYTANGNGTKKGVTLSDGLNFSNGTNTTAVVEDSGVVKFNLNADLTGITSISGGTNNATKITFKDGGIDLGGKTISNIGAPTNDTDAVNKQYVTNALAGLSQTLTVAVPSTQTGSTTAEGTVDLKTQKLTIAGANGLETSIAATTGGGQTITVKISDDIKSKIDATQGSIDALTLKYRADSANAQTTKISEGLDFKSGTNTTATVATGGEVKFDLKSDLTGINSITGSDKVKVTLGNDGVTLSKNGADAKLTGLAAGAISDSSKDAITGAQLKKLADKLGLTPDNTGNDFTTPNFTAIKSGDTTTNTATPTTVKDAVDQLITAVNGGLKFVGDVATNTVTRQLGQTLSIVSGELTPNGNGKTGNFVGKNLATDVKDSKLTIAMAETPEFKGLNLKDGTAEVKLTPTADGLKLAGANGTDAVKLTNLAEGAGDSDAVTMKQFKGQTLSYKANGNNTQSTKLSDGLNFTDGTNTTATVETGGVVKFNLKSDLTGINSISGPATGTDTTKITLGADNITLSKGTGDVKLTGLADGSMTAGSKDAVTGGQVFTELDKGLTFAAKMTSGTADNAQVLANTKKKFGETLTITTGTLVETNAGNNGATYVGDNLTTAISNAGNVVIAFKESPIFKALGLSDGTNTVNLAPTATNALKLTGKDNASAVTLTGVAKGTANTDAVNYEQLDELKQLIAGGFTIKDNTNGGGKEIKVDPNSKVILKGKENEIDVSFDVNSKTVTHSLAKAVTDKLAKIDANKDYVTTDSTLKYKANGGTDVKGITLEQGFNFTDGTNTTATVKDAGVVTFDLKSDLTGIRSITGETNAAKIALGSDAVTLGKGANGTDPVKLTGLAKGDVSADSKDAVTGSQLNAVATQLGLTPNGTTGDFTSPTFNAIQTGGTATNTPSTFKDAVDQLTSAINSGLTFKGEGSTTVKRQLGQTLEVVAGEVTATGTKTGTFVGKNLITDVVGGKLTIGMTETPEFKSLSLKDANNRGVTLTPGDGSLALNGTNGTNGTSGVTLSGLAEGKNDSDAINYKQYKQLASQVSGGFKVATTDSATEDAKAVISPNDTLVVKGTDSQITANLDKANKTISLALSKDLTGIDSITKGNNGSKLALGDDAITLSKGANGADAVKLTGLADGTIGDASKDAVTGSQLSKLATELGLTPNTAGTGFDQPTFTGVNQGGTSNTPTSFKDALDKLTSAVNAGLTFKGEATTTTVTRQLGQTLNIVSGDVTAGNGKTGTFVGKNLLTNASGENITIGMTETPEFKDLTLKDANNNAVKLAPYAANTLKLTGTTDTDKVKLSNLAEGTGADDAVTKGQVENMGLVVEADAGTTGTTTKTANVKMNKTLKVVGTTGQVKTTVASDSQNGAVLTVALESDLTGINTISTQADGTKIALSADKVSLSKGANNEAVKLTGVATATDDNDAVNLKQLKDLGLDASKPFVLYDTTDKNTITLGKDGNSTTKITKLTAGSISGTSSDAINGTQLNDLASKLGVEVADGKTGFKAPTFTAVKYHKGTGYADQSATTLKGAIDDLITAVNKGITLKATGEENAYATGTAQTSQDKFLGDTIRVAAGDITLANNTVFKSKNVQTMVDKTGDILIGMAEKPEFATLTLKDPANDATGGVVLTPSKDGTSLSLQNTANPAPATNSTVKLTNLADGTGDTDAVTIKQYNELKNTVAAGFKVATAANTAENEKAVIAPNDTLTIKGTDNQITSTLNKDTDTVTLSLNKDLKGIESLTRSADGTGSKIALGTDVVTFSTQQANGGGQATDVRLTGVAKATNDNDAVNLKQLKDLGLDENKPFVLYDSQDKNTITLGNGTNGTAKITKLTDGTIDATSSDAINGKQLKDLADKLGVGVNATGKTGFEQPSFTAVKYMPEATNGTPATHNTTATTTFKDAINSVITAVNRGLTFVGAGTTTTQKFLGDTVTIKQGEAKSGFVGTNLYTDVKSNELLIGMTETPEFKDLTLKDATGNTVKLAPSAANTLKLTGANGSDAVKLTNLTAGSIATNSTDAITGGQLNSLATQLGLTPDTAGTAFVAPTFAAAVKYLKTPASGGTAADYHDKDTDKPTTLKGAIDDLIAAVNKGITVKATGGQADYKTGTALDSQDKFLGDTIRVAAGDIEKTDGTAFKAKNVQTMVATNGDILVGIADKPEFSSLTLRDDSNPANQGVVLTPATDGGKLTLSNTNTQTTDRKVVLDGLKDGDTPDSAVTKATLDKALDQIGLPNKPINGIDGVDGKDGQTVVGQRGVPGKDGAAGTTVTGPAGKDGLNGTTIANKIQSLRDGVAGNVVYTDAEGNRLLAENGSYYKTDVVGDKVKANNGLWYEPSKVKDDGSLIDPNDTSGKTLKELSQESGDVNKVNSNQVVLSTVDSEGNTTKPITLANVASALGIDTTDPTGAKKAAITEADAKTKVETLLATTGASNLNKVVTLADLQAIAQAGLYFGANLGNTVHRPLGATLNIQGGATYDDTTKAGFSGENLATETTTDGIKIVMSKNPVFDSVRTPDVATNTEGKQSKLDKDGLTQTDQKADGTGKSLLANADHIVLTDKADPSKASEATQKTAITNTVVSVLDKTADTGTGVLTQVKGSGVTVSKADDSIQYATLDKSGLNLKDSAGNASVSVNAETKTVSGLADRSLFAHNGTPATTDYGTSAATRTQAATEGALRDAITAGMTFKGSDGQTTQRALGTTLEIVGEGVGRTESASFESASGNINTKVDSTHGKIEIQLSKNLKNIESVGTDSKSKMTFKDGEIVLSKVGTDPNKPEAVKLTGLKDGDLADGSSDAVTGNQLKSLYDLLGLKTSDNYTSPNPSNAPAVNDGLDGKSIIEKIETIRAGAAGNMVYTDGEGNRLALGPDGNFYKADELKEKLNDQGQWKDVNDKPTTVQKDSILLSAVNPDGTTTQPTQLANIKTGMALDNANQGKSNTAITADKAQAALNGDGQGNTGLLKMAGADLNKASTLADLQAVAQAGMDFAGNDETAVHRALGSTVTIKGEGVSKDDTFTSASGNIKVSKDTTADANGLVVALNQDLKNLNSATFKTPNPENGDDKSGVKVDGTGLSFLDKEGNKLTTAPEITKDGINANNTEITNVKSAIGGKVADTTATPAGQNTFLDNLNKVGTTEADAPNANSAVTVQDLKNLADTGFKVQTNDGEAQTVKAGQTVQAKNGANIAISEVTENAGVFSYTINVKGIPMTYVDAKGKPIVQVGDEFYPLKDNGAVDFEAQPTKPAGIKVVKDPTKLNDQVVANDNLGTLDVADGEIKTGSQQALTGGQLSNLVGANMTYDPQTNKYVYTDAAGTDLKGLDGEGATTLREALAAAKSEVKAGNDNIVVETEKDAATNRTIYKVSTSDKVKFTSVSFTDPKGGTAPMIFNPGADKDGIGVLGIGTPVEVDGQTMYVPSRIRGVADGVDDTDAANMGQLRSLQSAWATGNKELQAGIAGALAAATLVDTVNPGTSTIAVGAGTYEGQNAFAVGFSSRSDTGRLMLRVNGMFSTRGTKGAAASVGYQF